MLDLPAIQRLFVPHGVCITLKLPRYSSRKPPTAADPNPPPCFAPQHSDAHPRAGSPTTFPQPFPPLQTDCAPLARLSSDAPPSPTPTRHCAIREFLT